MIRRTGEARQCHIPDWLEGMANHIWRAQSIPGNHVILYAPVVKNEHFLNGISYLVRRMDEQTAPDNFLTHSFDLRPATETWSKLQAQFEAVYNMKDSLSHNPPRTHSRLDGYEPVPAEGISITSLTPASTYPVIRNGSGRFTFATVEVFRELKNWRRSLPKYAPTAEQQKILDYLNEYQSIGIKEVRGLPFSTALRGYSIIRTRNSSALRRIPARPANLFVYRSRIKSA